MGSRPLIRVSMAGLLVCVLAAGAGLAVAQSPSQSQSPGSRVEPPLPDDEYAFNTLDYVMDGRGFEVVCDQLELSEMQLEVAGEFWRDYWREIKKLDDEVFEDTLDAGLREYWEIGNQALREKTDMPAERVAALSKRYRPVAAAGKRRADARLNELLASIEQLLVEEQMLLFERAPLVLRKANAIRFRRGQPVGGTFRIWLDLRTLTEEAMASDGELVPLLGIREPRLGSEEHPLSQIESIVREQEDALDVLLLAGLHRRRHLPRSPSPDSFSFYTVPEKESRSRVTRWVRNYEATNRGVEQIGLIAADVLGPEAQAAWQLRYRQAFCPEVLTKRWPHHMVQWLEAREGVEPWQMERAIELETGYLRRRERIVDSIIRHGIAAKRKHRTEFGSTVEGRAKEQVEFVDQLIREKVLIEETIAQFRTILTTEQQEALDNTIASVGIYSGRLLRPMIPGKLPDDGNDKKQ